MKSLLGTIRNFCTLFLSLFHYKYIAFYILTAIVTYGIVVSGADRNYNVWVHTHINTRIELLWPADILGFLSAILLQLISLILWLYTKNTLYKKICFLGVSTMTLAIVSSTLIKSLVGRESPPHFHYGADAITKMSTWTDNSHNFNFGFLREQVFGGYPSSHATVFIGLLCAYYFCVQSDHIKLPKYILIIMLCLALFISLGVSLGHHWFSETIAGMVLGYVVGRVVSGRIKTIT